MKKSVIVSCLVFGLALLLVACGTTEGTSSPVVTEPMTEEAAPTQTDTVAPAPTLTEAPAPTPLTILYQDDFEDVDSGWERYREFDGTLDSHEGGYRMQIPVDDNLFWVNAGQEDLVDVRVEVDALRLGGPEANQFGLMCRLSLQTYGYYAFVITSQGEYAILKHVGLENLFLGNDDFQTSDVILLGDQSNHIRADCVGDTLSLYVNGELLLSVQDDEYQQGDVGLAAGTTGEPGTDIFFDNFVVYQP
jgi:hypothetical protein